jgi:virginiamycin B lyase
LLSQKWVALPGSDNALWFTEFGDSQIGRITTGGTMTEFVIPTADSFPMSIAPGPDGALWFTEFYGSKIGRITTAGAFTEYSIPGANAAPAAIAAGPDGALWFLEQNAIGRITTAGSITSFPTSVTLFSDFNTIITGRDNNLWFTNRIGNSIERLAP